jgi:hypothetical protein
MAIMAPSLEIFIAWDLGVKNGQEGSSQGKNQIMLFPLVCNEPVPFH